MVSVSDSSAGCRALCIDAADLSCSVQIKFLLPNKNCYCSEQMQSLLANKNTGPGRPSRVALYERLALEAEELHGRLGGLPAPREAERIWHGIWLEETHNSTAI